MGTIIPLIIEEDVNRHSYLFKHNKTTLLIDPGSKHHVDTLSELLSNHVDIKALNYIVLHSNDYLNISSIECLITAGFKGTIIVHETGFPYMHKILSADIKTIESLDFHLVLDDTCHLDFIQTPFLPFPETFVTYIKDQHILFSGHLASQYMHDYDSFETLESAVHDFHESVMPSIEFVKHGIKQIQRLALDKVYPRLGHAIHKLDIQPLLEAIKKYDFYNTQQVILKKNNKNVSYNYIAICNHMLKRLETMYHRQDILNAFKNSPITLEKNPSIEIIQTQLTGYKLWNGFFDIIYKTKGIEWLIILSPLVKKYNRLYNIKMPTIYKTKLIEQQTHIEQLGDTKSDLEEKIERLTKQITETQDKLLRDSTTHLYNQTFLEQHLINNINHPVGLDKTRALLLVQIDNLASINKKYGTSIGDETLRNLVYILKRHKQEDTLVFKQNGPGIYIYKHLVDIERLKAFSLTVRNSVKSSTAFIEPITVSLSIVTIDEVDDIKPTKEKATAFIRLTSMRLERSKNKGKEQIIDKHSDDKTYNEGVILLVDEDETNQSLIEKIFARIQYDVIIAKDIYEAYDIVETHNIDVIISEINLSKLDGFQFKRRLNESKAYRTIPFVIMSHHKNNDVIDRANQLDIDLILQKPITPIELTGHVKRFKEKRGNK